MGDKQFMTRRDALKRIGALVAGTALVTGGWSAYRVANNNNKRIIFFFSATGNSLYIARELADEKGQVLSVPQLMKKKQIEYEAEEIGFVFPDYAASAPLIMREFISKAKLKASYFFSVITFGNFAANVADWWNNYCNEHGIINNYVNTILMVDNYLPVFDMNEQLKIDKHIPDQLIAIKNDINEHKQFISHFELPNDRMQEMLTNLQNAHFPMTAERLLKLNEDACVACGTCATVCPHGNFHIGSETIEFSGNCEHCLACVHVCPQKALTLVRGERNPQARYRNEHVSLRDLKQANNQQ